MADLQRSSIDAIMMQRALIAWRPLGGFGVAQ
jgi:hypothetical protein